MIGKYLRAEFATTKENCSAIRKLKMTTWVGYWASVSEPHTDMRYVSRVVYICMSRSPYRI